MSWFSVLPVAATLLAEAPAPAPPAEPVVVPSGSVEPVPAPTLSAASAPIPPARPVARGDRWDWYGAPAVVADGTELALLGAVLLYDYNYQQTSHIPGHWNAPRSGDAAALLVLSSLVTGAVVHGLNHHWGRAVGSIAWRTFALLLAGALDSAIFGCGRATGDGQCPYHGGIAEDAVLFGLPLAAIAVDDLFFARDSVPVAAPAQAAWTPTLRIQSGLALLGIRGSF
jgi:hypothetical protein